MKINFPVELRLTSGLPTKDGSYVVYDVEDKQWMVRNFDSTKNTFSGLVMSKTRYFWCDANSSLTEKEVIDMCKKTLTDCGYTDAEPIKGFKWFIRSFGTLKTNDYGFQTNEFPTEVEAWIDAIRMIDAEK